MELSLTPNGSLVYLGFECYYQVIINLGRGHSQIGSHLGTDPVPKAKLAACNPPAPLVGQNHPSGWCSFSQAQLT